MKVTKNPFDKFTENCLTHFVFASVTFTWGWDGVGEGGRVICTAKIKNCIQIFQMMATHITDRTIKRKLGRATDHMSLSLSPTSRCHVVIREKSAAR